MRANQWKVKYKEKEKASFEIGDACLTQWAPVLKNHQVSKILKLYRKSKANSGCNSTTFTRFANFLQKNLVYRCKKKKKNRSIIHWNGRADICSRVSTVPFLPYCNRSTYNIKHNDLSFRKPNSVSSYITLENSMYLYLTSKIHIFF